jgi:hypothetical protein
MIQKQEVVVHGYENANGDVEPHVESHGGDILNFTYYNQLPHPSSQVEKMDGVFSCQFFCCNTFINFIP